MANVGLYRSNRSNMIAGVMGGIAERFGWNANLLRIIFVIVSCLSAAFPGILVYLVLWLVMPKEKSSYNNMHGYKKPVRTVSDDPLR
ncbi:PspC domain-containing protein [Acinetobacter celticus]|uniref:PspC family transcriptional regulator n=1 Tax=Acinetobacter celticus TaxID=1891224 RepID=A0A1C3D0R9_9GAMM|nr:PspC domain-containing protein [Acinetobacter celticus]ODA14417.1 PspC family transcriptional regulator [Acinetobacter celticus]